MALRLVRQTSDTPNITNKDDTIMTRYAYGGYNGIVKSFGSMCNYTAGNGIFKVLDGRIVIDGWEIDIDGAGIIFDFHNVSGTQYYSVYAEVNVSLESVKLDSTYLTGSYPEINKGDDLTEIPNGTAKLLLYNVKVENGSITEVVKRFHFIPYLTNIEARLEELGFKQGVVEFKSGSNTIEISTTSNSLIKQGKMCVMNLTTNTFNDIKLLGIEIPNGFRPKSNIQAFAVAYNEYTKLLTYLPVYIYPSGEVIISSGSVITYTEFKLINIGWQIA